MTGAEKVRTLLPGFNNGHAIVGAASAPFKCPPAPSECALLLHDYLEKKGVRGQCEITIVLPFGRPVPPSPETSAALMHAFAERNIRFVPDCSVASLNPDLCVAVLSNGTELPYDLFLGIPKHCAPKVVQQSGLPLENGYVAVNPRTLETRFPGVYAIGDIAFTKTPKAGVFAEGGARAVAESLITRIHGGSETGMYNGAGSCYIEFGGDRIGRVDVDFFSGPSPTGVYHEPTVDLRADKERFRTSRLARWFGM